MYGIYFKSVFQAWGTFQKNASCNKEAKKVTKGR